MISEAAKLYKHLLTIEKSEIPIIVPVFDLVTYAKFMVSQLLDYGLENFIICDNNSTYPPMIEYLDELSKTQRVVRFDENLGPRVFAERPEFLSIMPEYFIITDPDLIFNPNLPKSFLSKMIRIIEMYGISKVGFAIDIEENKDRFFNQNQVFVWEENYWKNKVEIYKEADPIYSAPIDTTFCMHKKQNIINELKANPMGITSTSAFRIAGRFTCEHMGWWKEQPISKEEEEYYNNTQLWASTYNEKRKLRFI